MTRFSVLFMQMLFEEERRLCNKRIWIRFLDSGTKNVSLPCLFLGSWYK